jgi:hypothetical protein
VKIALIPPISKLETTLGRDYQMLIPEALTRQTYRDFYETLGRNDKYFVMMDNGMFEHTEMNNRDLLAVAKRSNIQELVLPDRWADPYGTAVLIGEYFKECVPMYKDYTPKMAAVAHGGTFGAAMQFVDGVSEFSEITSVHISRSLTRSTGKRDSRILLADWIDTKFPDRFEIHFLGFDDSWHGEVAVAALTGLVRSLDTIVPYSAAYHDCDLETGLSDQATRPTDYFHLPEQYFPGGLVHKNIAYLDNLAQGTQ